MHVLIDQAKEKKTEGENPSSSGGQFGAVTNSSAMNSLQSCCDGHVYMFLPCASEVEMLVIGWMWV